MKTHKCDKCSYSTVRASDLKRHISAVHLEEKSYKCTYKNCEYSTIHTGNLKQHISTVHLKEKTQQQQQ